MKLPLPVRERAGVRVSFKGEIIGQIHPDPPLVKEGGSSLTNQQSVPPFSKGGLRGIYNTPYMPYCANTPNTMLRMFAPLPKS